MCRKGGEPEGRPWLSNPCDGARHKKVSHCQGELHYFSAGFLNDGGVFVKWLLRPRCEPGLGGRCVGRTIAVNNRTLPLIIRRTGRQKSIGVELTCRQEVIVRVPRFLSEAAISEGVNKCLPWLARKLSLLPPALAAPALGAGAEVLVLGEAKKLVVEGHGQLACQVVACGAELHVVIPAREGAEREAAIRAALVGWYRERAAEVIRGLISHYSVMLRVAPPSFSVTHARRRWGSCSASGRLNFAWRLAMAPPDLIEYVVVHELCHLKRRDHSSAFWALVAQVLPDYRERRKRLRQQGIRYDL